MQLRSDGARPTKMEMSSTIQKRIRGTQTTAAPASGPVQSLTRGLSLLEHLAEAADGITLSGLADSTALAPSTVHRLLASLRERGFALQEPVSGRWHIGAKAFTVGNAFLRGRSYVALARHHMRALVDRAGETANLAALDKTEAVYLTQIECDQMMRAFAHPGTRVPLHCSAVGKALLAALPEREAESIIAAAGLPRLTERTLVDPDALRDDLTLSRGRGFAIDDGEHAVGLRCVAAAILDDGGRPLAALSISGPAARIDDDKLEMLGELVSESCRSLTDALGGRPPDPR